MEHFDYSNYTQLLLLVQIFEPKFQKDLATICETLMLKVITEFRIHGLGIYCIDTDAGPMDMDKKIESYLKEMETYLS